MPIIQSGFSLMEIVSAIQWGVGGLFVLIGYFALRTLKQIDKNQAETAKQLLALSTAFYTLLGEHKALTDSHHRRHGDE